jgi:predicted transcriptional regulator of viral defense system
MTNKLNPIVSAEKLQDKHISLFSPEMFFSIFNVTKNAGKSFLSSYTKKGFFIKLKNGFYILKSSKPGDFEIANKIYKPSYISFETALSYHNILPETVYSITSATIKASREYIILDKSFVYHKIKKELFFGYDAMKINDQTIWIANKEKAFLDYMYFVALNKKPENNRLIIKDLSITKIKKYLKVYNSQSLELKIKNLFKF